MMSSASLKFKNFKRWILKNVDIYIKNIINNYISVIRRLAAAAQNARRRGVCPHRKPIQYRRDDQASSTDSDSDHDDNQRPLRVNYNNNNNDAQDDGFVGFEGRDAAEKLRLAGRLQNVCRISPFPGFPRPRNVPHCYFNPLFPPELNRAIHKHSQNAQLRIRAGRGTIGLVKGEIIRVVNRR